MQRLIKDKITTLTEEEAAYALNEAWNNLYGYYPHVDSLSILWAQSALETGRWKIIHCYNFGNIKKTEGHDYCMFRCSEVLNGKNIYFDPPHTQTHFNAYEDATAGATEYLEFISKRPRYKSAWDQVKLGNPNKYCAELRLAGYFTADLISYTKGVVSLVNEFKKKYNTFSSLKQNQEIIPIATNVDIYSSAALIPPDVTVKYNEIECIPLKSNENFWSLILKFIFNFIKLFSKK